jgi:hypothetical protein
MLPADVTLTPAREPDFAVLRELAGTIWRQHYAAIISAAQIDYMLAARFTDTVLLEHIQAADAWLELLRISNCVVAVRRKPRSHGGVPCCWPRCHLPTIEVW